MAKRKDIEVRLDGSPLELQGKSGNYELHNVHNEQNSFCSRHRTLDEVDGRIDTILGKDYGR